MGASTVFFSPRPGKIARQSIKTGTTYAVGRSDNAASINIPIAQLGIPVPAIVARQRIKNPNVIWYGNARAITETTYAQSKTIENSEVSGNFASHDEVTTIVKTTVVVGYRIDIMLGICLGPGVHLREIFADGNSIWSGDVGPARATFTLPANDTALGAVSVAFAGGNFDQSPDPDVSQADFPGHVGTAYLLLRNVRADIVLPALAFEVERFPNPLGLAAGDNRIGDDLNAASAMVEVMTNGWGFGGLDIAAIDTATFTTLAAKFKAEGNVAAFKIESETAVTEVIKHLQAQTRSVVFADPETGKITAILNRPDELDLAGIKKFSARNSRLQNWDKTGWPNTLEQLRGTYIERAKEYEQASVFTQSGAGLMSAGRGRRTTTIDYPYIPTATLAQEVLETDLSLVGAPIWSCELVTNRDGAPVRPGEIISITWPDYELVNAKALVLKVRKSPINQNNVVLSCRQAILPNIAATFAPAVGGYNPNIDAGAKAPDDIRIYTAPYWMARAGAGVTSVTRTPTVYPLVLAKPFNDFQFSFTAYIENLPGTTETTEVMADAVYPTYAKLKTGMSLFADMADGIVTPINIGDVVNPVNLSDIGNAGVRAGELFMLINDEILSFEGVTDNGNGTWTLTNVHRGLLDTVAGTHAVDDDVYIIGNNFRNVAGQPFSYPLGYVPAWLITGNTSGAWGQIADAFETNEWNPTAARTIAPPRPHNTKVDGVRSTTPADIEIAASCTVTWATRSRTATAVKLQLDAADTGEIIDGVYQVHRVFIVDSASASHDCGVTADSASLNTLTFTVPTMATGAGELYVQAETTMGGVTYTSIQQDRLPVNILPATP